jgi:hypothetical protein
MEKLLKVLHALGNCWRCSKPFLATNKEPIEKIDKDGWLLDYL